jgi:ribonuclease HI
MKMTDTLYVYTDATVRGRKHSAFIGYVVEDEASNVVDHSSKFDGHMMNNNISELNAAVYAIKQVQKKFRSVKHIVLFTDSVYVVHHQNKLKKYLTRADIEVIWIAREYNAADNEVNTCALRSRMPKSRRRIHWERVALHHR